MKSWENRQQSSFSVLSLELAALEISSCLKKVISSFYLIKQGVLIFLQSFNEGLELIFASAIVSCNKSLISRIGNVLSFLFYTRRSADSYSKGLPIYLNTVNSFSTFSDCYLSTSALFVMFATDCCILSSRNLFVASD